MSGLADAAPAQHCISHEIKNTRSKYKWEKVGGSE
ncbi:hypothetical protein A2U01_0102645, partial [Trifolium medium]|nr:hypothetical protein [Trifolium medium]